MQTFHPISSYLLLMILRFANTLAIILVSLAGYAQQFGGFPPSTKWNQINTDTARIIFTSGATLQAQRAATLVHQLAATDRSLGNRQGKINIVLHGNTTLANGYVGLGPWRSEFYLVPGSNIFQFGNLPWVEQLAVHEYRHVKQYNNFNHGISRVAGVLFGQEGRALANALAVPDWFFEGDAVYAETALTPQGRGKTAYFFNGFNSLWREGRNYNWMKLRNGSLKDLVPNHYPLGYLLVNYGYLKYGPNFWRKVTQDATAFRGLVAPFPGAIKRYSGVNFKTFRKEALHYYTSQISQDEKAFRPRATVTDISFPQVIGADSLLYLKESYKTLPAVYIRDAKGEHRIKLRSISGEDWISYRNGTVAYTAYGTHPRWSLTDYSDIVLLDIHTGKEERITKGQKLFSPALSPDDSTLVALSINDSLLAELHFLNRRGELLQSRRAPAGATFIHPQYIDAQTVMVGIRQPNSKITLHRLDLTTMKFEQLLPPTFATVGFFYPYNGSVYFTSSLAGRDDLYSYRFSDKQVKRLTNSGIGHYFPSVSGNTLTWSEATSNGFRIRQAGLDSIAGMVIPIGQWGLEQAPFEVAGGDSIATLLSTPTRNFPIGPYKKGTGLLNFHSWRPAYTDPEFSLTLYGNNVLNTLQSQVFYRYNENEVSHAVGFSTSYGGLFPVLSAGVEHIFERTIRTTTRDLTVSQTEARVGYSIPLNVTGGKTYKILNLGSNFIFSTTNPTGSTKAVLKNFQSTYLHHFLSWNQQLPRARQHIYPRLGYGLATAYRHRIDTRGYQATSNATIYLPSPFATHNIIFTGSFQQVDTSNVLFSNRFANSRGYPDYYFSRMWKGALSYHLPLLYPDFGIANTVYLLRVRGSAFYDYARVFSKDKRTTRHLRSTGGEVFFDTKWFNSLPVTLGVRYSYLLDGDKFGIRQPHVFELVLPVSLIPGN
jgi:hypothetical protein